MMKKENLSHSAPETTKSIRAQVRAVYERVTSPQHYQLIVPSLIAGVLTAKSLERFTPINLDNIYTDSSGTALTTVF